MDDIESILCWLALIVFTACLVKKSTSGIFYNGSESLNGKVIIITGANSGIGFETALELCKRGAKVILACRDEARGLNAMHSIKLAFKCANVEYMPLDLSSYESIRGFVILFKRKHGYLNILINNAGIIFVPHMFSKEGIELNFAVNHLGHFLLTLLLLPMLKCSNTHSRIILISSLTYIFSNIQVGDLNFTSRPYNSLQAYADSKCASLATFLNLAKKFTFDDVSISCVDPGIIFSNIGRDAWFMSSFFYQVLCRPFTWLAFKGTRAGAQTSIYCACSKDVETKKGGFYSECEQRIPWPIVFDENLCDSVWKKSFEMLDLTEVELASISEHIDF
ncbi:retinol dehydrogenase 12 isoform X1 [Hydra vulgaris]|uniref:Retinol dehydrogenase 12 isoform X1 n=1 Tax=Hydra vulgaris TaxID=6087 RepID=A0ABM4CH67_HYDVU